MNIKLAKAGAYFVAAAAAAMSYGHQKTLYLANGLEGYSFVVPVVVDVLALLAAAVRNADGVTPALRRTATWTLAAAGLGSVAANVAVATNPVQVAVGVGTVGGYLLAENFVAAMKRSEAAKAMARPADQVVAAMATVTPAIAPAVTAPAVAAPLAVRPAIVARPAPAKRSATVTSMATAKAAAGQAFAVMAAILAERPHLSTKELVAAAGVGSERTARRVRAHLAVA